MQRRRDFLKYLASSPALALSALPGLVAESLAGQSTRSFAGLGDGLISTPDHAINVFDFEAVARRELPPAHWGYLATGTDDDETLAANREGFSRFQLRPRRLVDIREIDMSVEIFGERWPSPIAIAPTGRNQAFHPEGELAVARAAREKDHLQILSTVTSTAVEKVAEARGKPIWYQLYARYSEDVTFAMAERAEAAGCPAIVLTVDLPVSSNRETARRLAKLDERDCLTCHADNFQDYIRTKPMFAGLDVPDVPDYRGSLTWDFVRKLRDRVRAKLLIKGIVTAEDAKLALRHGVDGIIVSNHGGRAEASGRSTIEALPPIVEAVGGRLTVLIDSGFRRGTDFFKALALGADGICIGRPYLWGLSSFGQAGVEAVLEILRRELEIAMKLAGTPALRDITEAYVAKRSY